MHPFNNRINNPQNVPLPNPNMPQGAMFYMQPNQQGFVGNFQQNQYFQPNYGVPVSYPGSFQPVPITRPNAPSVTATPTADEKQRRYKVEQQRKFKDFGRTYKQTNIDSMLSNIVGSSNKSANSSPQKAKVQDDFGEFLQATAPAGQVNGTSLSTENLQPNPSPTALQQKKNASSSSSEVATANSNQQSAQRPQPTVDLQAKMMASLDLKQGQHVYQKFTPIAAQAPKRPEKKSYLVSSKAANWSSLAEVDGVFQVERAQSPTAQLQSLPPTTIHRSPSPSPPSRWISDVDGAPLVYKHVYEACVSSDGLMDTSRLRPILLQCNLPNQVLGQLWSMANQAVPGRLNQQELFVLLALIALTQSGQGNLTLASVISLPAPPVPFLAAYAAQSQSPVATSPSPVGREGSLDGTHGGIESVTLRAASGHPSSPKDNDFDDFQDFQSVSSLSAGATKPQYKLESAFTPITATPVDRNTAQPAFPAFPAPVDLTPNRPPSSQSNQIGTIPIVGAIITNTFAPLPHSIPTPVVDPVAAPPSTSPIPKLGPLSSFSPVKVKDKKSLEAAFFETDSDSCSSGESSEKRGVKGKAEAGKVETATEDKYAAFSSLGTVVDQFQLFNSNSVDPPTGGKPPSTIDPPCYSSLFDNTSTPVSTTGGVLLPIASETAQQKQQIPDSNWSAFSGFDQSPSVAGMTTKPSAPKYDIFKNAMSNSMRKLEPSPVQSDANSVKSLELSLSHAISRQSLGVLDAGGADLELRESPPPPTPKRKYGPSFCDDDYDLNGMDEPPPDMPTDDYDEFDEFQGGNSSLVGFDAFEQPQLTDKKSERLKSKQSASSVPAPSTDDPVQTNQRKESVASQLSLVDEEKKEEQDKVDTITSLPLPVNKPNYFVPSASSSEDSESNSSSPVNWKSVITTPTDQASRYVEQWERCLAGCLEKITRTNKILSSIKSSDTCKEVVYSARGQRFTADLGEVYGIAKRVRSSERRMNIDNDTLQSIHKQIELAWHNLLSFCPDASFTEHIPSPSDEDGACGVCLEGLTGDVISYAGQKYHTTCANFWVNSVDRLLPALSERNGQLGAS